MKKYNIRDENGVLVGKISGKVANKILQDADGFWRQYKTDDENTRCFEISEAQKIGLTRDGDSLIIFLWEGTVIVED